ncbi:uracil-DNA glycosylase [Candidatus Methylacidithermus pantelleriae]|uniref:Type-4 uracil-DNA glycosylase n=1 Tax=Candidatus Methylacidithermus pantelleriae TaxID=2744239 RepID=A0A8J2FNS0_9BACT|nr:uracil-DNA glycosylase [Candidatus Methylacidithermus pantelleriae]CAF0697748.1 Type-4 uracil-DNA glycosylase [Candidatus Methylacidithermus pantelleriae]
MSSESSARSPVGLLSTLKAYLLRERERGRLYLRLSSEAKKNWEKFLLAHPSADRPGSPSCPAPSQATSPPSSEVMPVDERRKQLEKLAQTVAKCCRCPHLAATRTQTVFGIGSPSASLFFVGEAPGAEEDRQGQPFVGPAGQLLTKMIRAMGLEREQVYIANVLKCRPNLPEGTLGNRRPTEEEVARCLPYLHEQIEIVRPKAIVALGGVALEGLLGKKALQVPPGQPISISRFRGRFLEFRGIPVMPTYHPSYLLHNPSIQQKRKVWEDLLAVMERLGLPISQRQREYFLPKPSK